MIHLVGRDGAQTPVWEGIVKQEGKERGEGGQSDSVGENGEGGIGDDGEGGHLAAVEIGAHELGQAGTIVPNYVQSEHAKRLRRVLDVMRFGDINGAHAR